MTRCASGYVYVLRLAGYPPRRGAEGGLVKVGCAGDVRRRLANLSCVEKLAEFVPEAQLHPLLYTHDELVELARRRYMPLEVVFESGRLERKFSAENACHDELDRLGLRVVEKRELFFWNDVAAATVDRVCRLGRGLEDHERDDVHRQTQDPTRPLLCESCGEVLEFPQWSLICVDCCTGGWAA